MFSVPFALNITNVIPFSTSIFGNDNGWMLYIVGALVLGILIGGLVKGIAKLVLGIILISGFVLLFLIFMQKQDTVSMIASVVFGIIMLVFSFVVKARKSYPYAKR